MSLNYFKSFKYEYSPHLYQLEQLEHNIRLRVFIFEISSLKSKDKVSTIYNKFLLPKKQEIIKFKNEIKGFNFTAYFIGIFLFHTFRIYKTKILLNEMKKNALTHIIICNIVGIISGCLVGYTYSYSFKLYREYKKTLKRVDNLINNYVDFYIDKKEEVIDE